MSRAPELLLRMDPSLFSVELLDKDRSQNLLEKIPISRLSFDWPAAGSPILVVEVDPYFWGQETKLDPEQVTFIKRCNVIESPEWIHPEVPFSLSEGRDSGVISAGHEIVLADNSHHLLGSGEVETDHWDKDIIKYRMLVDWDPSLEQIKDVTSPEDICVCGHKRIFHRPRLICGRLLNDTGVPIYCNCMKFQGV